MRWSPPNRKVTMNIRTIAGSVLIAAVALSGAALASAAAAQALPKDPGTGGTSCLYNGQFYPHGSAHPTMTDTFCDNGVWKHTLTNPTPEPASHAAPVLAPSNVFQRMR
jgi:hypothetical protein